MRTPGAFDSTPKMMTRAGSKSAKRGLGQVVNTIAGLAAGQAAKVVAGWSGAKKLTVTPTQNAKRKLNFKEVRNPFGIKGKIGLSTAYYRGKVRAKRRKAKSDLAKETFMAKGICASFEYYGSVTDPHCVHIGHSTHSALTMPGVIARALVRKLFSKAGYEIDDSQRVLPLIYSNQAQGITLVLWGTNNSTGALEEVERYNTAAGTTLQSIVDIPGAASSGPTLYNIIRNLMVEASSVTSAHNLDRIDLMIEDNDAPKVLRYKCSLNLRQHKLVLMSKSSIQIQNRSKGASSADVDATAVDNQPLKGYMYQFGQAAITTKSQGTIWNKDAVNMQGVIKRRAADFSDDTKNGFSSTGWQEPQPPGIFNRVSGYRKVILQPGDIKTGVITQVYKGYFNEVMQQLAGRASGSNHIQGYYKGKSQLWSMEEVINTGANNDIIVQFEVDKTLGAYFVPVKKRLLLMSHNESALA
jgi:hypothetical protein